MAFLLDSNIVSELWKPSPASTVPGWLKSSDWLLPVVVITRQPQALWDSLIDAMAVRHGAKIATRNQADFRHATVFNPWTGVEHLPGAREK